jgi:hypothetical protein
MHASYAGEQIESFEINARQNRQTHYSESYLALAKHAKGWDEKEPKPMRVNPHSADKLCPLNTCAQCTGTFADPGRFAIRDHFQRGRYV